MTDVVLPSTRDVNLNGEMYAYHEALFAQMAGPLSDPDAAQSAERRATPRPPTTSADAGRSNCCAAPSTTRSATSTWWCCRRAGTRRAPSTPPCKREETDVPRNPELENTGQFNVYGIPAISVPCGFTSARACRWA